MEPLLKTCINTGQTQLVTVALHATAWKNIILSGAIMSGFSSDQ